MTGRERTCRAIEFNDPDRVPLVHAITPFARRKYGARVEDFIREYPGDIAECGMRRLDIDRTRQGRQRDKWGCIWKNEIPGLIGYVAESPLADWNDAARYQFPDPDAFFDLSGVSRVVAENDGDKFLFAPGAWLWQRMFWVRGHENILMDIAEQRDEVLWLRDRVLEVRKAILAPLREFEIDAVWCYDDWGDERRPQPFARRLVRAGHMRAKGTRGARDNMRNLFSSMRK